MFDKFVSLFRGQVKSAVVEGSREGLDEAATGERVRAEVHQAVVQGVEEALSDLHLPTRCTPTASACRVSRSPRSSCAAAVALGSPGTDGRSSY
jgi:hypothetical protein